MRVPNGEPANPDDFITATLTFNARDAIGTGTTVRADWPRSTMTWQRACGSVLDALDWALRCSQKYEAPIVESHIEPVWASDGQVDEFVRFDVSVTLLLPLEEG